MKKHMIYGAFFFSILWGTYSYAIEPLPSYNDKTAHQLSLVDSERLQRHLQQHCESENQSFIVADLEQEHVRDGEISAFELAHEFGDFPLVKALIHANAHIEQIGHDKRSPLQRACDFAKYRLQTIEALLDAGANPNVLDSHFYQPVLMHVIYQSSPHAVQLLLDAGANIEARRQDGSTALIVAAGHGHLKVLKILLNNQPNLQATRNDGINAIFQSIKTGNVDVVRCLLEAGANPNIGWEHAYANSGLVEELISLPSAEPLENIIARKAEEVSEKNPVGLDIELAVLKEVVVSQHSGAAYVVHRTPIHQAASQGDCEIIKLLIDSGVDLNVQQFNGSTPLLEAVRSNRIGVVQLLLEAGANMNIPDISGATPWSIAQENKSKPIIQLLRMQAIGDCDKSERDY